MDCLAGVANGRVRMVQEQICAKHRMPDAKGGTRFFDSGQPLGLQSPHI
jgi:hypothetical protein